MDRAALRPVILRAAGLLAVSIIVLLLVLRKAGPAEVALRLSDADPVFVASALLLFGLEIAARMARSVLLVRDLPARRTVAAWAVGSGVNEVAPPGASEAARAWVASRWYGASAARVFAPAVLERIFDVVVLAALGLTAVVTFADVPPLVAFGVGVAGAALAIALAVAVRKPVERLAGRSGVAGRVGGFAARVHEAFRATARRPMALAGAMGLTLVVWVLAVSEQVLILRSVGLTVDFALMAGVTGASVLVGIASFLPGGLGAREAAYAALLASAHYAYAAVASGVVAFRVLQALVMLTLATVVAAFVLARLPAPDALGPGRGARPASTTPEDPLARRDLVVAILPAYDLEKGIGAIVARTRPFVDHVIVVCDGSKDGTAAAARAAGAIVPEPEAVRGKGFAVIKGIEASRALAPSIVVLMDSDGQHLPEELPVVLAPLKAGACDMVVGSRMLGTLRTSFVNKVGNVGLKVISFAVTWRWMTDTESGFRAFRADKLYALRLTSRGYEIEGELLLKALHRGYRVVEVPITVPFAVPGVTVKDGLKAGWYKLRTGIRLRLGRET